MLQNIFANAFSFLYRNPNLPTIEDLQVWPSFEPSSQLYIELNVPTEVKHHIRNEGVKFWLETVPTMAKSDNHSNQENKDEL